MTGTEDLMRQYRYMIEALQKENKRLETDNQDLKIKLRLCNAKNEIIYERNSEQYFNSKK